MKLSLAAATLAAVALAASGCGSSHPASTASKSGPTVSSTRVILGGTVRCTATVKTPAQVGHVLGMTVAFHNLSRHTVNVPPGYGGLWVVVSSPDGTTYDTRIPVENEKGPGAPAIPVQPGATATERLSGVRVRWEGPLRVTPGCGVSAGRPVRVAVSSPGLPASANAAVTDVVAASGHLLKHCRPRTSGVSVVGRINAPDGSAPPLQARCSITLRQQRGFYVAQLLVVTPPGLRGAGVHEPYEDLTPYWRFSDRRNAQVIGWEFVVTRNGARSVYSADSAETRSGGRAPDFAWTSSGGQYTGGGQCGFTGGGFGGLDGPTVTFVSACGR